MPEAFLSLPAVTLHPPFLDLIFTLIGALRLTKHQFFQQPSQIIVREHEWAPTTPFSRGSRGRLHYAHTRRRRVFSRPSIPAPPSSPGCICIRGFPASNAPPGRPCCRGPDSAGWTGPDQLAREPPPDRRVPAMAPSAPVAQVAQSVEQRIENPRVAGSIPALGTTFSASHAKRAPTGRGTRRDARSGLRTAWPFEVSRSQALPDRAAAAAPVDRSEHTAGRG